MCVIIGCRCRWYLLLRSSFVPEIIEMHQIVNLVSNHALSQRPVWLNCDCLLNDSITSKNYSHVGLPQTNPVLMCFRRFIGTVLQIMDLSNCWLSKFFSNKKGKTVSSVGRCIFWDFCSTFICHKVCLLGPLFSVLYKVFFLVDLCLPHSCGSVEFKSSPWCFI